MKMSTRAKTAALAAVFAILSRRCAAAVRASADAGPIKVALLAPTSGSAAAAGHDMVAGWTAVLERARRQGRGPHRADDGVRHRVESPRTRSTRRATPSSRTARR